MSNPSPRSVLATPASLVGHIGEGFHQFSAMTVLGSSLQWVEKVAAETDETMRQIIPVAVIRDPLGRVLAYKRSERSGEKRLHSLWSCLVGGHIEESDDVHKMLNKSPDACVGIVHTSLRRELQEEFGISATPEYIADPTRFLGPIYYGGDAVGRVHVGLVFEAAFKMAPHLTPGEEVADYEWIDLGREKIEPSDSGREWEPWSAMVLARLAEKPCNVKPSASDPFDISADDIAKVRTPGLQSKRPFAEGLGESVQAADDCS